MVHNRRHHTDPARTSNSTQIAHSPHMKNPSGRINAVADGSRQHRSPYFGRGPKELTQNYD